jgi:hypothetical protein
VRRPASVIWALQQLNRIGDAVRTQSWMIGWDPSKTDTAGPCPAPVHAYLLTLAVTDREHVAFDPSLPCRRGDAGRPGSLLLLPWLTDGAPMSRQEAEKSPERCPLAFLRAVRFFFDLLLAAGAPVCRRRCRIVACRRTCAAPIPTFLPATCPSSCYAAAITPLSRRVPQEEHRLLRTIRGSLWPLAPHHD